jgi:hypothetical protein
LVWWVREGEKNTLPRAVDKTHGKQDLCRASKIKRMTKISTHGKCEFFP